MGVPTNVFGEGSLAEATFTAAALVPEIQKEHNGLPLTYTHHTHLQNNTAI